MEGILDSLDELELFDGPVCVDMDSKFGYPTSGLHLDMDSRRLGYWTVGVVPTRRELSGSHGDWVVVDWLDEEQRQVEAAEGQLRFSYDEEEVLEEVVGDLFDDQELDVDGLLEAGLEDVPDEVAEAEVNPLFFDRVGANVTGEERREFVDAVVRRWMG